MNISDQSSFNTIQFVNSQTGYVSGGGIWKTTNAGDTWFHQLNTTYDNFYGLHFADANVGFAVGYQGIIAKTLDGGGIISIKNISNEVPQNWMLSQNYPNPFNPSTKIKLEVKKSERIIIKVYDLLGKEIAALVNQRLNPGSYELTFNAGNIPSGVYFYRLEAGDFIQTKKMIFIK